MKKIMFVFAIILISCCASAEENYSEIYLKVGTGYKFSEQDHADLDGVDYYYTDVSPYSARIEIGIESGNITYGVSHHSQWATGFPFNDTGEYYKTEIFIDYKFSLGL